ncbi:hypothetical protein ACHAXR_005226 [Thalassiosira sp. AJA248-18]
MASETAPAMLTDDFKKRAKAKLEAASAGKFFQSNSARLLPSFDRSCGATTSDGVGDSNRDELTLGVLLGEGAFCYVKEITAIVLKHEPNSTDNDGSHTTGNNNGNGESLTQPKQKQGRTDEAEFPVNLFNNKSEIRHYMSENYMREGESEKNQARYALKHLKPTNAKKQLEQGLVDISMEAQFLSYLAHPNIVRPLFTQNFQFNPTFAEIQHSIVRFNFQIKMRGVAGEPLTPNYGLVLDRLYETLENRMDAWSAEIKMATGGGLCGCLFGSVDVATKKNRVFSAITVAYDMACALRYIHSQNLVYRDIKPENAGFDVRGDIKLFDFGFCKELVKKLFDKPSGLYKLTKMTGSRPYMAPENFLGNPYGKSVDVFSFGVLLWEMLHFKYAFYHFTIQDYKDMVVKRNYRPSIDKSLSTRMQTLIKETWDPDPKKRPTIERVSLNLRAEFQELSMDEDNETTRSMHLMNASRRSFTARHRKK